MEVVGDVRAASRATPALAVVPPMSKRQESVRADEAGQEPGGDNSGRPADSTV